MVVLDRDMEPQWEILDLNAITQRQYEVGLDCCEGSTNWACSDDTAMYQHIISTAPYTQYFNPNISTPESTEQSNECSALSSPSVCEERPCLIEKRRAQNRASQRAYRQRQTCYIRTLEQELEEIRAKYEKLRKCLEQVKEAVCEVEKEDWAGDSFESCNESLLSGDEKKRMRSSYA